MHMRKKYKEKYKCKIEIKLIELQIALLIMSKIFHLNKILYSCKYYKLILKATDFILNFLCFYNRY